MRSPRTYIHSPRGAMRARADRRGGFTMIEILVTTAILAMLIGMGLFMSFDFYRHTLANDERDVVVSLLLKARERSLANMYQSPHGVCFISPNYILFRGTTCVAGAANNETIAASKNATISGMGATSSVIFSQIAATTTDKTINITQDGNVKIISINNEGRIDW